MKKMLALIMISVAFGAQAYVAPAHATPAKTEKKVEKKEAKPKAPPSATKPTPKKKIGEAK